MMRPVFLACLFFLTLSGVNAQEQVNLAQHQKLPLLAEEIVFLPYRTKLKDQADLRIVGDPGTWRDVRLVEWAPPVATISGKSVSASWVQTNFVHVMSFPPALRPRLTQLAPLAAAAKDVKSANTLILKNGRRLEDVKLIRAVPSTVHLSHSAGEEDIPLKLLEANYSARHNLTPDSIYYRQLTLKDGTALDDVRIVAKDPENTRIMHSAGSMTVKLQDLPPEVADLVETHLISKSLFRDEVLSSAARAQKERVRTPAAPTPTPIPAPKPELIRNSSPLQYTQLPLNYGKVLHNVTIVGFDANSLYIEGAPGETSVGKNHVPPEVLGDMGDMPYDLLIDLLSRGMVARERSPIFEAIRNPNSENPFANATGGRLIGHVGAGYIVKSNRYRNYDGAAAALPKPFDEIREVFVLLRDFLYLGEEGDKKWRAVPAPSPLDGTEGYRPLHFRPCRLDANSILLDAFEGKYTLFGNERNVMKRAWQIVAPGLTQFNFIETEHGFFFGRLSSKADLVEAGMTWPQLVARQSMPFALSKASQKPIKANQPIIKLADNDGSTQAAITAFHPSSSQITSAHYRRLIEQGIPGLMALMQVPQTDGVSLLGSGGEAEDFSRQKETRVSRVALEYVSETDSTLLTKFVIQLKERTVERSRENGRVTVKESPWKDAKKETFVELPKDTDGGVRLTDGQKIYEIQPNRVTDSQIITYEVKPNVLNKKTR